MGERKGQNKYYPPDFDYRTHKSLAGYHGQHPLRERARKLDKGILIIRFEMPYNIWCDGCNNHIGMGVRYNAEKSKVGMYYTTPLWKFRMKCHLCDNHFEIKTDPANHDYVIIVGARRKEQRWDPKENEQIVPEDKDVQKKLALDAMYKLEHGAEDKSKMKTAMPGISQITHMQHAKKDDYILNKLARDKFRAEKKSLKASTESDLQLLNKSSLNIELVPESEEDIRMAELLKYSTVQSFEEKQKQKQEEIANRPLFTTTSTSPSSNEGTPEKTSKALKLLKSNTKQIFKKQSTFNSFTPQAKKMSFMNTSLLRADLGIITSKPALKSSAEPAVVVPQEICPNVEEQNLTQTMNINSNTSRSDHKQICSDSDNMMSAETKDLVATTSNSALEIATSNALNNLITMYDSSSSSETDNS